MFEAAKARGVRTLLEQTIAPRIVEENILANAAVGTSWKRDVTFGKNLTSFCQREASEWALADTIICGSEFVAKSIGLAGGPVEKCKVVPYGVELTSFGGREKADERGKLRVLFLGTVSYRKGAHFLGEAARRTDSIADWRVVGGIEVPIPVVEDLRRSANVLGSVPRSEIPEQLAWADVLVLPSLCEGSATVTYEALAAGVPVICTESSGSIVESGRSGLLMSNASVDELVAGVTRIANDRSMLRSMSRAAIERAKFGSLEAYGKRLVEAVS